MKINKKFSRCNDCNKLLSAIDHIRCAECYHKYRIGYKHSKSSRKKMSIIAYKNGIGLWNKGRKRPEHSKRMKGEKNPNYNGGLSKLGYTIKFKYIKELIRRRDNHICQNCNKKESEFYRKLDVHHIDYNKQNSKEKNLISLCQKCHLKTNVNRNYWYAYYTYLMDIKNEN